MVCVVISYHYLTSTTLKQRWEGAWGSVTLNRSSHTKSHGVAVILGASLAHAPQKLMLADHPTKPELAWTIISCCGTVLHSRPGLHICAG